MAALKLESDRLRALDCDDVTEWLQDWSPIAQKLMGTFYHQAAVVGANINGADCKHPQEFLACVFLAAALARTHDIELDKFGEFFTKAYLAVTMEDDNTTGH